MKRSCSFHQFESGGECAVKFLHFSWAESAHISGQDKLGQAHQFVATDRRIVLQTLLDADVNLGRKPVPLGVHWSADHRRQTRIDRPLPADYHIRTLPFWIERVWLWNQIQVAAQHLVEVASVFKYVFGFLFEVFGVGINNREVARASIFGRGKPEITSNRPFHKTRPVGIGFVNLGQQFFREQK